MTTLLEVRAPFRESNATTTFKIVEIYPERPNLLPKVRTLIDFLISMIGTNLWWDEVISNNPN